MSETAEVTAAPRGHGFGTGPVFLASIGTILGAVMFLRFGYAVGHTGLLGALLIVLIGHAVTVPTALALAEDQLIMSRVAVWGPIIPIGLACATLSSAIGSILVAPRTLQALGADAIGPTYALSWSARASERRTSRVTRRWSRP